MEQIRSLLTEILLILRESIRKKKHKNYFLIFKKNQRKKFSKKKEKFYLYFFSIGCKSFFQRETDIFFGKNYPQELSAGKKKLFAGKLSAGNYSQ